MADQWMRFGSAVQFLQALGPQTERMREEVEKEERVCCLWLYLTLVTLSWFLNISKNLLLSSSLIGRIHNLFSQFQDIFSICFSVWVTHNFSKRQKQIWLFCMSDWHMSGFLWAFLSLSLLCTFFPSLVICTSLSRLSLSSSLSVSLPVTPPWWWAGEGYWVNWACSVGQAGRWRWRWTTHHSALQNQRQRSNSLGFIPPPDKKHCG